MIIVGYVDQGKRLMLLERMHITFSIGPALGRKVGKYIGGIGDKGDKDVIIGRGVQEVNDIACFIVFEPFCDLREVVLFI